MIDEHAEPTLPPSHTGTVLLDIGGDVGALVVHCTAALDGDEIDLYVAGDEHPLMHSAVRRREVGGATRYAAVYSSVPKGRYRLEGIAMTIDVAGGTVTEVHLR